MDSTAELKQPYCDLLELLNMPACDDAASITHDDVSELWASLDAEQKAAVFIYPPLSMSETTYCHTSPLLKRIDAILEKDVIDWKTFLSNPYVRKHLYTWDMLMRVFEDEVCDVHVLIPPKYTVRKNALQTIKDETFEDNGTRIGPFRESKGLVLYKNNMPCFVVTTKLVSDMMMHVVI